MAAKDRAAKAGKAARAARSNPYVMRLIEDEDLRSNLRTAYERARGAYGRMANGKAPTRALLEDKKLQKQLREAAQAISEASTALREAPKRRRNRRGIGRTLLIVIVGAGLAVALSEGLRSKVLDALFGSEEEFDYTSTTSPATPAPETVSTG
jgi:ferric-dicitrate binding protein FerR (iron transport regulator)